MVSLLAASCSTWLFCRYKATAIMDNETPRKDAEPQLGDITSSLALWVKHQCVRNHSAGYTPYVAGGFILVLLAFFYFSNRSGSSEANAIRSVIVEDARLAVTRDQVAQSDPKQGISN